MPLMDIIKVPGITPSAALLVYAVGYTNIAQLRERDPLDMYDSVLERLVIRSTDCRLLTKARSNDLKREISGLQGISPEIKEALSTLSEKLANELFGREKRQALMNGLRLASSFATFGPIHMDALPAPSEEKVMSRLLATAHLSAKDVQAWTPEDVYERIFWSTDLSPETAEMLRRKLGLITNA